VALALILILVRNISSHNATTVLKERITTTKALSSKTVATYAKCILLMTKLGRAVVVLVKAMNYVCLVNISIKSEASSGIITNNYYQEKYRKSSSLEDENYPHFSSSKSEEISVWRVYGFYIVSSICCLLLITMIICNSCCHKKTTIFLVQADFLPITGGTAKKCSGGIITMFYIVVILGLIVSYIV
jgi:hypothetical protein